MKESYPNHYERAFENWLIDNNVEYVAFDEHKRAAAGRDDIKSFDFLLYLPDGRIIITEVKGRTFRGTSLENLSCLESWVTAEDVEGLTKWQEVFGPSGKAIFVFVYRMDNIDVDFDGRAVFEFDANRYLFFCIALDDYCRFMKRRSPKWQTVTLPADKFRQYAVPLEKFLF